MKKIIFDRTVSVDELLNAFRAALIHSIAGKPRGIQAGIAKFAGISTGQVTNIVKGLRPGNEARRRLIALALGYEYEDFLALGQSLIKKSKRGKPKADKSASRPAPTLKSEDIQILEDIRNILLKKGRKAKELKVFLQDMRSGRPLFKKSAD
jgi:transcriptional regulator with XRE-family HTH domain